MTDENIKLLDELAKRFGIVIDWTSENVMPYLEDLFNRFITYHIVVDVFYIILLFAMIWFDVWFIKKSYKMYEEDGDNIFFENPYFRRDATPLYMITSVIVAIVSLIGIMLGVFVLLEITKLLFIPEVFMIDWLNVHVG